MTDEQINLHHEKRINSVELSQVKMTADIDHIKNRIDGGLSITVTKIWDKVNALTELKTMVSGHDEAIKELEEEVKPVRDNSEWIGRIKSAFVWVAVGVGILGGGLAVAIYFTKVLTPGG